MLKVGCDLVHLPRFNKAIAEHTLVKDKVFTLHEQQDQRPEHLAGIFAAKEAAIKALNLKAGNWQSIEIRASESLRPELFVLDEALALQVKHIEVSITHDGDYAMATAVAEVSES